MENNLDKLFKSKLGGQEPEFHPAAWDRMEGLLDEAGMVPVQKKKKNRNGIFYLTLLCIGILFSVIGYSTLTSENIIGEGSTMADSMNSNLESNQNNNNNRPSNNSKSEISNTITSNSTTSYTTKTISNQDQKINDVDNNRSSQTANSEQGNVSIQRLTPNNSIKNDVETKAIDIKQTITQINQTAGNENDLHNKPIADLSQRIIAKSNYGSDAIKNDESAAEVIIQQKIEINKDKSLSQEEYIENEIGIAEPLEDKTRIELVALDLLNMRNGSLSAPDRLINPKVQILKPSVFEIGIQSSIRRSNGLGYSIGPYVRYNMRGGYSLNVGGQFDSQSFGNGAELSVFDKVYSFGSELIERKFTVSNQKSMRIPVELRKSFGGFSLSTGAILNKVFATQGITPDEENPGQIGDSFNIDSEMIHPITISLQLGASFNLSRHFEMDFGVEYRPKAFVDDTSIANDSGKYYPSLGLRYKLFKF